MKRNYKERNRSGISIETNFGQIVGVVFVFLLLFVLPIELTNLNSTGELQRLSSPKVLGTSTTQASTSIANSIQSVISADMILYIGIALGIIALGIFIVLIINSRGNSDSQKDS